MVVRLVFAGVLAVIVSVAMWGLSSRVLTHDWVHVITCGLFVDEKDDRHATTGRIQLCVDCGDDHQPRTQPRPVLDGPGTLPAPPLLVVEVRPAYPAECTGVATAVVGVAVHHSGIVSESWIESITDPCFATAAKLAADQYRYQKGWNDGKRRFSLTFRFEPPRT